MDLNNNPRDPDFIEENDKLKDLIKRFDYLLKNFQRLSPYPEIELYATADDYDEVDAITFKKKSNRIFYETKVKPWEKGIECPYFGRIDLDIDGEFETIYIGEKDLHDEKGNLIVYSGQNPVARFFYQNSLEKDNQDGRDYQAYLRRRIFIENRELKGIYDVFVKGLDLKYNKLTDPYLMEILRRNRRERKMFSILSSIQENQYDIVTQDYQKSFIVQGCAGSGKTAILFQRFSNIAYRVQDYLDERVRFITPNKDFNEFVGPLAESLGLDNIIPITLSDYYIELGNRYRLDSIMPKSDEVVSDYELDNEFIEDIYSDTTLYNELFGGGKNYIDSVLNEIDFNRLSDCLSNFGYEKLSEKERYNLHELNTYLSRSLIFIKDEIVSKYDEIKSKIDPAKKVFNSWCKENGVEDNYPNNTHLNSITNELHKFFDNLNGELTFNLDDYERIRLNDNPSVNEVDDAFYHLTLINKRIDDFKNDLNDQIALLRIELETLDDENEDEWNNVTLPALKKEIADLEEARNSMPFFSFIRKARITNRINEINDQILAHDNDENSIENIRAEKNKKLNILLNKKVPEKISDERIKYCEDLCDLFSAVSFLIQEEQLITNFEYINSSIPKIQKVVDKELLSYPEMRKKVILKVISSLCEKHNIVKPLNSVKIQGKYHVFNLYLEISLANFFLNKPSVKDKFICVDEGQEYSPNEYALILDINSNEDSSIPINIYGDVNQRSSSKGIRDWKQLSFISDSIFTLKENYRNSREIVEYTNKVLNLSDIPIGVNEGIPVRNISLEEAKTEIEKGNICVILKEKHTLFDELSAKGNLKKYSLSVMSPTSAKGQEFAKVLVFVHGMDDIEKYISFTRGKMELLVCDDKIQ